MSGGRDRDFVAPVERLDSEYDDHHVAPDDDGGMRFRLNFDPEERGFLVNLLAQLKNLLTSEETVQSAPLLHRLFPPAFHDDPEKEAEYQRLMREELVASRVAAIDSVSTLLSPDGDAATSPSITLSEPELMAFMQSVNAIRLVLGTLLDITDDESSDEAEEADSYEFGLYEHLGWILEFTVRALSGG